MSLEERDAINQKRCDQSKILTTEQHEARKRRQREYLMRRKLEQRPVEERQRDRRRVQNLTPEQHEAKLQRSREYYRKQTSEQRQAVNQRRRVKNLTPEQLERVRLRQRERYTRLTTEQRGAKRQRELERQKKLTSEQIREKKHRDRERQRNLTSEQIETRKRRGRERWKNLTREQREARKSYNKNWLDKQKNITIAPEQIETKNKHTRERQKNLTLEQHDDHKIKREMRYTRQKLVFKHKLSDETNLTESTMVPCEFEKAQQNPHYCYQCKVKFSSESCLCRHLMLHVSLPKIVISNNEIEDKTKDTSSENLCKDFGISGNFHTDFCKYSIIKENYTVSSYDDTVQTINFAAEEVPIKFEPMDNIDNDTTVNVNHFQTKPLISIKNEVDADETHS